MRSVVPAECVVVADATGSKEYEVMKHHTDPFTGGWQGVAHIVTTAFEGSAKLFYNPVRYWIHDIARSGTLTVSCEDSSI